MNSGGGPHFRHTSMLDVADTRMIARAGYQGTYNIRVGLCSLDGKKTAHLPLYGKFEKRKLRLDLSSVRWELILTGLLGAVAGGYLTHHFTKAREAYARMYSFREKQLSEFYAPMLAHITRLVVGWELVEHLQKDRNKIIKEHQNLDYESREQLLAPVAERHRKQYADQLELLTKCCDIAQNSLHLAEPKTRTLLKPLFRFFADSETVKEFHIPIDATGQTIASPSKPFSQQLKELFYDIESVYKRLSAELRSGKLETATLNDKAEESEISVIEKEFVRPVLTVRKVGIRLGDKIEGFPMPAGNIPGSAQYTVPIYLKNEGTVPLQEFYLCLKVPTCFLIPTVKYVGASNVDGDFTWFEFTENHRQIDLEPQKEDMACSLAFRVTRENHDSGNEPQSLEGILGVTKDYSSAFTLSLADLNLYDRFS